MDSLSVQAVLWIVGLGVGGLQSLMILLCGVCIKIHLGEHREIKESLKERVHIRHCNDKHEPLTTLLKKTMEQGERIAVLEDRSVRT